MKLDAHFEGRTALITGGASGIGRAVAGELTRAGARVWIADVAGAPEAGRALGCPGVELDVTDPDAVAACVRVCRDEDDRLDLLFNNAGIGVGGEVRDQSLEDWTRVLDVNLRGVVHGIHAAYPILVEQGSGHIVNTASLAGLVPFPLATPYVASKHAVVGLSTSLRAEAAALGVRVSVVCPGYVRTPIVERAKTIHMSMDDLVRYYPGPGLAPESAARAILRGVARNRAVIPVTSFAHVYWRLHRLLPGVGDPVWAAILQRVRRLRPTAGGLLS